MAGGETGHVVITLSRRRRSEGSRLQDRTRREQRRNYRPKVTDRRREVDKNESGAWPDKSRLSVRWSPLKGLRFVRGGEGRRIHERSIAVVLDVCSIPMFSVPRKSTESGNVFWNPPLSPKFDPHTEEVVLDNATLVILKVVVLLLPK